MTPARGPARRRPAATGSEAMTDAGGDRLAPSEVAAFVRDGAVLLRGRFRDWVEPLREGLARNLAEPGPYVRRYTPDGNPGDFFGDYCNWQRIPEYRAFVTESPAARIAARLMGSPGARFFHEHILVKEPGTLERTPWHQDLPYYCVDGGRGCSLWMPLDPVARDCAAEFVAGSHRWGRRFAPRRFVGTDFYEGAAEFEPLPDIDDSRGDYRILAWDMAPGDAVAFDFRTVHGAAANRAATRRRAFASRWLDDDMTYAVRPGETSPPFPELAGRLSPGDPLPEDVFPRIWPPARAADGAGSVSGTSVSEGGAP